MKSQARKRPNIVSVHLSPEAKQQLDDVCDRRGMTIKTLLGRLISWFIELDMTEQSIVLGQVESSDVRSLAQLVLQRRGKEVMEPPARSRRRRSPQEIFDN